MALYSDPLWSKANSGESHTKPVRPMPVSGEQIINIVSATEAYSRLLNQANNTFFLYQSVAKPAQAASYEVDMEVAKQRVNMDRLDPGEGVFFYISPEDQTSAKRNYDEHPDDPNSRVMSHLAYLNLRTGESAAQAIARHELCIVPIGTVKSPGSEHEPDQHSTADAAGTVSRRNTCGRTITAGSFLRWCIPLPSALESQSGQESHTKGTRPVLQLEPIDNPKQNDVRYWPLVQSLARFFRAHIVALDNAAIALNVAIPVVPLLTIADIAGNTDLGNNAMPRPLYIKSVYDQLLNFAQIRAMMAIPLLGDPNGAGALRVPNAAAIRAAFNAILNAVEDNDEWFSNIWINMQLASRDGTFSADKLNGGLALINAPDNGDNVYLPMHC